jgi:hypothetical protein
MCVAGHAPDQDVDADGGAGCPGISDDISDVPDDLNGSLSGTYDPSAVVLAMMKPTREDNQRVRRILAVIAALLIAAVLAVPAQAAAPRYILVSGPGLQRPVVLGNWRENLDFLIGLLPADRPKPGWQERNRPRYNLALFWGVPAQPVPTNPSQASQHGWFYPATGGRRAVVKLLVSGQDHPRVATRETLRILAHHGVPTRIN